MSTVPEIRLPASPVASDFRDGLAPTESDMFIAVMGVTGAGKSTFISHLTQKPIKIGHDLQACTQDVDVYPYQLDKRTRIFLIDTPGFDDTNRSDSQILKEIAGWLTDSYSNKIRLNGIIYFHRISDLRMQGSAKRNLFMFKKLCGRDALKNVVLATTMWERVKVEDGAKREQELVNTPEFWGWMTENGSRTYRHDNTLESANRLLRFFTTVGHPDKAVLAIQQEMVDGGKSLDQTDAGIELESVLAKEREKFRRELAEAKEMMQEAIETRDKESAEILRQQQDETNEKIEALQRERQQLKISMEKLHEEKYAKLVQRFAEERERTQKMQRSVVALQEQYLYQLEAAEEEKARRELDVLEQQSTVEALTKRLSLQPLVEEGKSQKPQEVIEEGPSADEHSECLSLRPPLPKRPRSAPRRNRIHEHASVALWGSAYCFVGPAWDTGRTDGSRDFLEYLNNSEKSLRVMAFGQKGSFYAHYHDRLDRCWTVRNTAFAKEYPRLQAFLSGKQQYTCPIGISLGPNGSYFFRSALGGSRGPPESYPTEDFANINRMWLGYGGSYVIERLDGSLTWQLQNQYGRLGEYLRDGIWPNGSRTIKDLAINPEDPESYFLLFTDTSASMRFGGSHTDDDNFQYEEYMTKNFGIKW